MKIDNIDGIQVIRTAVPPIKSEGLIKRAILFISFIFSSLLAIPYINRANAVWAANPNILGMVPSRIFGKKLGAIVAMNVDDLWPDDIYDLGMMRKGSLISMFAEALAKKTYEKADIITPISPAYVDVITKKYSIKESKIKVIRAGVDLSKFQHEEKQVEKQHFEVLYSGAFSSAYDFDQVLQAAELLQRCQPKIRFLIQGGGELAGKIHDYIKKKNLTNVILINRIMTREDTALLLRRADTLLLPLRYFGRPYRGISSKLYEYQAAGKPIICCCNGQPADYILSTHSGLIVKPGDYEALTAAIITLFLDQRLSENLGRNGRLYVESFLSLEKIGQRMLDVLSNADGN